MTRLQNHGYKPSIETSKFDELNPKIVEMIKNNNPTEFNYLSLSIRNHKQNSATSLPSDKDVVRYYLKNHLIEIDPLSCFERMTTKKIITFYELSKYKNHGKCGETYMAHRNKSGLIHGFHYIHRHKDFSFTVVLGTDFKQDGFATDEHLIEKNQDWVNSIIRKSLLILDESKEMLLPGKGPHRAKYSKNDNINILH